MRGGYQCGGTVALGLYLEEEGEEGEEEEEMEGWGRLCLRIR